MKKKVNLIRLSVLLALIIILVVLAGGQYQKSRSFIQASESEQRVDALNRLNQKRADMAKRREARKQEDIIEMMDSLEAMESLKNSLPEAVPEEYVVIFKKQPRSKIFGVTGVTTESTISNAALIKLPKGKKSRTDILQSFKHDPNVKSITPNYYDFLFDQLMPPNDEHHHFQWNLNPYPFLNPSSDDWQKGSINLTKGWEKLMSEYGTETSRGSPEIIVAVIDSGVAYEDFEGLPSDRLLFPNITCHPDLCVEDRAGKTWMELFKGYSQAPDLERTNFVPGWDFVHDDSHPNDDNSHGTHVAGTIAQSTGNEIGVAGIAPGVSIMPIKVANEKGVSTHWDLAQGIRYAVDNGADIINMSLGGRDSPIKEEAIQYAHSRGVFLVAAAGNSGRENLSYPAAYPEVFSVGATRADEHIANYSTWGSTLNIMAPGGERIKQTKDEYNDGILQNIFLRLGGRFVSEREIGYRLPDFQKFVYSFNIGTSMAAPHVAGVAALLLSTGKANSANEVKHILEVTAKDLGPIPGRDRCGFGLLDLERVAAYPNHEELPQEVPTPDERCEERQTPKPIVVLNVDCGEGYDPSRGVRHNTTCTLQWDALNYPNSCVASGDWSGEKNTRYGTESVGPLAFTGSLAVKNYEYALKCSNEGGSSIARVVIKVNPPESLKFKVLKIPKKIKRPTKVRKLQLAIQVENTTEGPAYGVEIETRKVSPAGFIHWLRWDEDDNDSRCTDSPTSSSISCSLSKILGTEESPQNFKPRLNPLNIVFSIEGKQAWCGTRLKFETAITSKNKSGETVITDTEIKCNYVDLGFSQSTIEPISVNRGETFTYNLRIKNYGQDDAANVISKTIIPSDLISGWQAVNNAASYCSLSKYYANAAPYYDNQLTCRWYKMKAGKQKPTKKGVFTVKDDAPCGEFNIISTVDSDDIDNDMGNNTSDPVIINIIGCNETQANILETASFTSLLENFFFKNFISRFFTF